MVAAGGARSLKRPCLRLWRNLAKSDGKRLAKIFEADPTKFQQVILKGFRVTALRPAPIAGAEMVSLNSVDSSSIESVAVTIGGIQPQLADFCGDFTKLIGHAGHVNVVGIISEKEEPSLTSKGRQKLNLLLRDMQHMELAVTAIGGNASDLEDFEKEAKVIIFGAQLQEAGGGRIGERGETESIRFSAATVESGDGFWDPFDWQGDDESRLLLYDSAYCIEADKDVWPTKGWDACNRNQDVMCKN